MSVHVTSWVLSHSDERLGRRLVLLVLADHANEDGTGAYPSVETIAREARLSVSQAKRCLRDLRESGAIEPTGTMPAGNVIYSVLMTGGAHIAPVANRAGGGAHIAPRTVQEQPSKEPPPLATLAPPHADDVDEVFSYWQTSRSKPRARLTPKRRQKIEARLREGSSVAELKLAIDGVARDPWKDRPLQDDILIIFRNREQVEKFLDLAAGRNGGGTALDAARLVQAHLDRKGAPR